MASHWCKPLDKHGITLVQATGQTWHHTGASHWTNMASHWCILLICPWTAYAIIQSEQGMCPKIFRFFPRGFNYLYTVITIQIFQKNFQKSFLLFVVEIKFLSWTSFVVVYHLEIFRSGKLHIVKVQEKLTLWWPRFRDDSKNMVEVNLISGGEIAVKRVAKRSYHNC